MKKIVVWTVITALLLSLSGQYILAEKYYGAYEKEVLTTDFNATGRAFYALARVNAKNATGTYLKASADDGKTLGFFYNGCLVQCLYPPENGWAVVESYQWLGMVSAEDLSFDLSKDRPSMPIYYAIKDVEPHYEPREDAIATLDMLHQGQQCTVL